MKKEWNQYDPGSLYDELIAAVHQPREASYKLVEYLRHLTPERFRQCVQESEAVIREMV